MNCKIKQILYIVFVLGVVFCIHSSAFAQESAANGADELDKENITHFIETIENPEEREKFIDNLKALTEVEEQQQEDESIHALSDVLGLEETVSGVAKKYKDFLKKYDLDSTILGKTLISAAGFFVLVGILFIVRKLGVALREKVLSFSREMGLTHSRFRLYARIMRYIGYMVVILIYLYSILVLWDFAALGFFNDGSFYNIISNFFGLSLIVLLAIAIWEVINSYLEKMLYRASLQERNRLRTLLPIVRNVIFIVFAVLFSLVFLSELGIDIIPLLAGAGILGIAIGFGAQTMVKDFLTGFTIILEDLIQVGDVARIGGKIGLIEKITIRKVQLRDLSGIVYTVPFSDVGIIENWTKDFSYYSMDIGVAYREDTDEVIKLIKEIGEDLCCDEDFKNLILEPIEVFGVDAFADSAVIIKARIKTKPIRQWDVGREFNRRMKYKFDEHGVEIPFPHQTIYFGEDKKGDAPAAAVRLMEQSAKASE